MILGAAAKILSAAVLEHSSVNFDTSSENSAMFESEGEGDIGAGA